MGGYGSGGHNKTHRTIEKYRRLDSFDYRRYIEMSQEGDLHEMFGSSTYCGGAIMYDALYEIADIRYGDHYIPLKLHWVTSVDGSKSRLYFGCPLCKHRARYLYNYKGHYVCRHCLNANYESQQYTKDSLRNIRRQMKKLIEDDMGYKWWRLDNPGKTIDDLGIIPRPRYMRLEKHSRLVKKYRDLQEQYTRLWCKDVWAFLPSDMKAALGEYM